LAPITTLAASHYWRQHSRGPCSFPGRRGRPRPHQLGCTACRTDWFVRTGWRQRSSRV